MADDDWKDLGAVWQDDNDTPDINVASLTKNIRRRAIWTQVCFVAEMLICLFGLVWGSIWVAGYQSDLQQAGLGAAFIIFSLVGGYAAWWSRKGVLGYKSGTALEELKFVRDRAIAGVRYAKVNLWSMPVGFLLAGHAFWYIRQSTPPGEDIDGRLIKLMIIIAVYIVGIGVWGVWYLRKKTHEVDALNRIIAEIED